MPRTKLSNQSSSPETLKKIIDIRLIEISKDKAWLSVATGIKYRTLMDKLSKGSFDYKELYNIFTATQMPQKRILKAFGKEEE